MLLKIKIQSFHQILPLQENTENKVKSKLLDADPSLQVVIRGDGKVEYEKVMIIMAELQRSGAQDIGLITRPPAN